MKHILAACLIFLFTISSYAQKSDTTSNNIRKNDIGISYKIENGENDFGLIYRRHLEQNVYLRTTGSLGLQGFTKKDGFYALRGGITLGLEKRYFFFEKFYANCGVELAYQGIEIETFDIDYEKHSFGISAFAGINYNLNSRFSIGAEINPFVYYSKYDLTQLDFPLLKEQIMNSNKTNLVLKGRINVSYNF